MKLDYLLLGYYLDLHQSNKYLSLSHSVYIETRLNRKVVSGKGPITVIDNLSLQLSEQALLINTINSATLIFFG